MLSYFDDTLKLFHLKGTFLIFLSHVCKDVHYQSELKLL